jgi:hypothetical protein
LKQKRKHILILVNLLFHIFFDSSHIKSLFNSLSLDHIMQSGYGQQQQQQNSRSNGTPAQQQQQKQQGGGQGRNNMSVPMERRPSDYVVFDRTPSIFSKDAIARTTAAKMKLELYYKHAVEAAIERNNR